MPLDWTHTGGGGLGSWPSPVDRASHDPVYGLRPRCTERAFSSWRPLGQQSLSQLSVTNLSAVSSGATPAGFEADFGSIICANFCNVTRCYAPPKP